MFNFDNKSGRVVPVKGPSAPTPKSIPDLSTKIFPPVNVTYSSDTYVNGLFTKLKEDLGKESLMGKDGFSQVMVDINKALAEDGAVTKLTEPAMLAYYAMVMASRGIPISHIKVNTGFGVDAQELTTAEAGLIDDLLSFRDMDTLSDPPKANKGADKLSIAMGDIPDYLDDLIPSMKKP